jgi:hypothetical protein
VPKTSIAAGIVLALLRFEIPSDAREAVSSIPAVVATRASPVRIYGRVDDTDWSVAQPISGFVQAEPSEGAAVEQPTEGRVLFERTSSSPGRAAWLSP